jgi:hypothetical protein
MVPVPISGFVLEGLCDKRLIFLKGWVAEWFKAPVLKAADICTASYLRLLECSEMRRVSQNIMAERTELYRLVRYGSWTILWTAFRPRRTFRKKQLQVTLVIVELHRLEAALTGLGSFTPTDKDAVAAAKRAADTATSNRTAECDKRGPNCRAREFDEQTAASKLATVTAAKATTDRATRRDRDPVGTRTPQRGRADQQRQSSRKCPSPAARGWRRCAHGLATGDCRRSVRALPGRRDGHLRAARTREAETFDHQPR